MTTTKKSHEPVVAYGQSVRAPVSASPVKRADAHNYEAACKIVIQHKGVLTELPEGKIEIGLLTSPPSPEGSKVIEPADKSYHRQEAKFAPMRAGVKGGTLQNVGDLAFGPVPEDSEGWPEAKCVGVFVDGKLLFYGLMTRALVDEGGEADRSIRFSEKTISLAFK